MTWYLWEVSRIGQRGSVHWKLWSCVCDGECRVFKGAGSALAGWVWSARAAAFSLIKHEVILKK